MLTESTDKGKRMNLYDPVKMPQAAAFLWNPGMMIHMNCRGFAVSQFMQPEPAKYAHSPNLEAKTFMQPEQPYYAHHAGRFCYVRDLDHDNLFSVPYEPVKQPHDSFCFSAGQSDIKWRIVKAGLHFEMTLQLSSDDLVELWTLKVTNQEKKRRNIRLFPYFPVGYMSWMNQSGAYDPELNGIVCSSISPYQKYQDYQKVKNYKDNTFLLADKIPDGHEANQKDFEGEGGLHYPSAIARGNLNGGEARYETPACVFQYNVQLNAEECATYKFVFGPANDHKEISVIKKKYLDAADAFEKATADYKNYIEAGSTCLSIDSPDSKLNNFVNHWLPRQIYYHGETNRLCTDPQTRNYLQDNMGMAFIKPQVARKAFVTALEQQQASGAMPDGVLIVEGAELKYINQVPHTDHCVWLPISLKAYLEETNDRGFLEEKLGFADSDEKASVAEHLNRAMKWLLLNRDERGLNYINQGDWCDPMNMVGYKGKGVSGWLTMATSYAIQIWLGICESFGIAEQDPLLSEAVEDLNKAVNTFFWDRNWYGRGITDDNVLFGIKDDPEGRIFLNPQAWALLSNCPDAKQEKKIMKSVAEELETPFGVEMLAPAFTSMREDIGRVTQKHPGSAENGSVYNHAAAFYIYALYTKGYNTKAYHLIDKMIPGPDENDIIQRGQLPVFIPNYYRGAYKQFPRTAGRSSQLFNTGTVHWIFRCLVEGLFGVRGEVGGLRIRPQLPDHWPGANIVRIFRGASFHIEIKRKVAVRKLEVTLDGALLEGNLISDFKAGRTYSVLVEIPEVH